MQGSSGLRLVLRPTAWRGASDCSGPGQGVPYNSLRCKRCGPHRLPATAPGRGVTTGCAISAAGEVSRTIPRVPKDTSAAGVAVVFAAVPKRSERGPRRLFSSAASGEGRFLRGPTFEVRRDRRRDARPGLAKMYRVPPDRAWWPAVGPRLDRGVGPRRRGGHRLCLAEVETACLMPLAPSATPWANGPADRRAARHPRLPGLDRSVVHDHLRRRKGGEVPSDAEHAMRSTPPARDCAGRGG